MSVRLILWDIDHTLLELHRLHYDLYARALPAAFEREPERLPDMTGRTDRDSSTEFLQGHGIEPTEPNLARFWDALVEQLTAVEPELSRIGHPTEGAEAALAALAAAPDVHQSVLTGNLRPLAERKLAAFALDRYLSLDVGGYGEDGMARADLVPAARARYAARFGVAPELARTVLIGDSPLDIEAARKSGAVVIAVATGRSSHDDLTRAGADAVLDSLTDTEAVVRAVDQVAAPAPRTPAR